MTNDWVTPNDSHKNGRNLLVKTVDPHYNDLTHVFFQDDFWWYYSEDDSSYNFYVGPEPLFVKEI